MLPGSPVGDTPAPVPPIAAEPTGVAAFVGIAVRGPVGEPIPIGGVAEFEMVFGALHELSGLGCAVRDYFRNGGRDAVVVRVAASAGAGPGCRGRSPDASWYFSDGDAGVRALDRAAGFGILVLPPAAPAGRLPDEVWRPALEFAQRRGAFLLVDPPPDAATPVDVATWCERVGLRGPAACHAAAYVPRLRDRDALPGDTSPTFAPSGAVAGLLARTDATHGVWKAPAGNGAGLVGTPGPTRHVTDAVAGQFTASGINTIRSLPGAGTVVWGSRTLCGGTGNPDATDGNGYVPVRRTALFIEQSVAQGTRWTASEPNAEPLWAVVRASVGDFLTDLFRRGAFQGATPAQAFFVRCGADTTTQADIDDGVVNVLIGFAPLRPGEFATVRLALTALPPAAGGSPVVE